MTEEEIQKAAVESAMNMGAAENLWHPYYGWILKDGEITRAGIEFFVQVLGVI